MHTFQSEVYSWCVSDWLSTLYTQELMSQFHNYQPERSEAILSQYPALIKMEFLPSIDDLSIKQVH